MTADARAVVALVLLVRADADVAVVRGALARLTLYKGVRQSKRVSEMNGRPF